MTKTLRDYGIELRSEAVGQHTTTCPECRKTRKKKNAPCLSVKITNDETKWNCHHCGWRGGLRDGVQARSGDDHWKSPVWVRPQLTHEENWTQQARGFFHERKIYDEVLARNKVFVAKETWIPQLEGFYDAIAFPFYRMGECINVKYRGPKDEHGDKTLRLAKNAERIFYGLDDILTGKDSDDPGVRDWAVIVEGEMDKLAMDEAGYPNVLSPPNGAPSANAKDLDRFFDFIQASNFKLRQGDKQGVIDRVGRFIIAVDADDPGKRLQEELVRRLGPERCAIVTWPVHEGKQLKDANEVLMTLGADAVREAIERAHSIPIAGVFSVRDFEERIWKLYRDGLPPGLSTPWKSFRTPEGRELYTGQLGTVTVLTAIPGGGKTEFLLSLVTHWAQEHGWFAGIFSPEAQPLELLSAILMQKWSRQPFGAGFQTRMDEETVKRALDFSHAHFRFILPEDGLYTPQDVLDRAEVLVRQHGLKALMIDPWNNLSHRRPRDQTIDQYVGEQLLKIQLWAKKWQVWVVIAAHPTKMEKVRNHRGTNRNMVDPVPTPYEIKGASEWFDMADFCISLWRDKTDETQPSEVHILKVKFRHLGVLGVAKLRFDSATGIFYDSTEAATAVKTKAIADGDNPIFDSPDPDEMPEPWWMK